MWHISQFEWAKNTWTKLEVSLRKVLVANDATTDSVDQIIFKLKPRVLNLLAKSPRVELSQIVHLIKDVRFELKLNSVIWRSPEAVASLDQVRDDAGAHQAGRRDSPAPQGAPLDSDRIWPALKVVFIRAPPKVGS
jgi:hypothetical protein